MIKTLRFAAPHDGTGSLSPEGLRGFKFYRAEGRTRVESLL
jgi:hypothetical protein